MSTAAPPRPALDALTGMRFVAAFAVLLLHYRDMFGPLPPWLLRGVVGGQYGVTFFFVLSGFILTWRYHDWFAQGVSDTRFWWFQRLRLARLYPVYVLGLLLDTPWHLIERAQAGALASDGATYWAAWLINLVGLQAWVPAVPFAMLWNTPAWSVAAELFFYALFPFVCGALARRVRSDGALLAAFAAVVLGGIGLYAAVIYTLTWVAPVGEQAQYIVLVYNPLLRLSEFLAGCVLGQYFLRAQQRPPAALARSAALRNAVVCACLLLVALRVWAPDYTGPSRWLWLLDVSVKYGVFIVPFSLLILAVASGRTWLGAWLERPWLVLLGEASYALYILHWAVLSFLHRGFLGAAATPAVHALFMFGTVGLAVLCYRFFELPWRRRLRGRPPAGLGA